MLAQGYETRSTLSTTQLTQNVWARRLKEARLAAGLSQRALGVAAGIDESVASTRINRYEVGVHAPDFGTSVRIAAVLNLPVAFLYCDVDELAEVLVALHRADLSQRAQVRDVLGLR